jgi:hypothetical protein
MPSNGKQLPTTDSFALPFGMFAPALEYMVDAAQRSVLFWDVMRQRGNQYREHMAEKAPHVLDYNVELVIDGRTLHRVGRRSRPRQVRRLLAGAEFREPEPRQHAVDQAVQSLFQDRHRGAALSRLRALVGWPRQAHAEEIQFIVDELFIGNNLTGGKIKTSDGTAVDLRNIRSPILVFCSQGDNITPPQQALGWFLDLYEDVDEIRSYGQTIVYTVHQMIGHLGIFVSGGVAKKEHGEFSSNIDLIDALPPGLYEAVFESKTKDTANPDLAHGEWVMRCEARTLDDIRALGGNDAADERHFATAARVSDTNLALYRTYAQPLVRSLVNAPRACSASRLPWRRLRISQSCRRQHRPKHHESASARMRRIAAQECSCSQTARSAPWRRSARPVVHHARSTSG